MFVERADALDPPPMSWRSGAGGQPSVVKRRRSHGAQAARKRPPQRMAPDRPRKRLPPHRQNDLPRAKLAFEVAREAEP